MFTNLKRIISFACVDFYRNKGISFAAIFVLIITTLLVTGLLFARGLGDYLVTTVQNKIDITAYFKVDTAEQDILSTKDALIRQVDGINNITYVSQQDALNDFTDKHKDSSVLSKALLEVGDNPFLPSLNITTTGNPQLYEQISTILQQPDFSTIVEKVDFYQKKDTIEKVFSITSRLNQVSLIICGLLLLVAILVVFNTIKLVIDRSKTEIATMNIVGASHWFIKAPFIIEGALFGLVSFLLCMVITVLAVYFTSDALAVATPGFSLLGYFLSNLWLMMLVQFGFGVGLGILASFVVVRTYLD